MPNSFRGPMSEEALTLPLVKLVVVVAELLGQRRIAEGEMLSAGVELEFEIEGEAEALRWPYGKIVWLLATT